LPGAKDAGVRVGLSGGGVVAFYEEHATRREAGYKLEEWYSLNPWERALEVAVTRYKQAIDNHTLSAQLPKRKK
jgi:hypothetical protein